MPLGPEGQYDVEDVLGDGVTGRVLRCTRGDRVVAVKVSRATPRQRQNAEEEAAVLRALQAYDAERAGRLCVRLLDTFVHNEVHFCLVLEPLPASLRGMVAAAGPGNQGLLLPDVRDIMRQLLEGLSFMHEAGFAHTDLKCTNVMLRDGRLDIVQHPHKECLVARPRVRPCEVVLIDFGMAERPREGRSHPTSDAEGEPKRLLRVGARHVRAPEVVLGLDWSVGIDMWSLGCLVYTLYTGDRLFSVHSDDVHLATMEHVCEEVIPAELARGMHDRIAAKGVSFDECDRLRWPEGGDAVARIRDLPTVREAIGHRHGSLYELMRGLLDLRPQARLSAPEALRDAFFRSADDMEE